MYTLLTSCAGSSAAILRAYLGSTVAKGSIYAILQSAGAGGMSLVAVKAIAASTAMAETCSAAAVGFLQASEKDDCKCEKPE